MLNNNFVTGAELSLGLNYITCTFFLNLHTATLRFLVWIYMHSNTEVHLRELPHQNTRVVSP